LRGVKKLLWNAGGGVPYKSNHQPKQMADQKGLPLQLVKKACVFLKYAGERNSPLQNGYSS